MLETEISTECHTATCRIEIRRPATAGI